MGAPVTTSDWRVRERRVVADYTLGESNPLCMPVAPRALQGRDDALLCRVGSRVRPDERGDLALEEAGSRAGGMTERLQGPPEGAGSPPPRLRRTPLGFHVLDSDDSAGERPVDGVRQLGRGRGGRE